MKNPNAIYCILYEDLRPEIYNKVSIMGFYGLTPDVEIRVKDLTLPLERLTILLGFKCEKGKYTIGLNINNPSGSLLKGSQSELSVGEEKISVVAVSFAGIIFSETGQYTIHSLANGKEFHKTAFRIFRGEPQLFA